MNYHECCATYKCTSKHAGTSVTLDKQAQCFWGTKAKWNPLMGHLIRCVRCYNWTPFCLVVVAQIQQDCGNWNLVTVGGFKYLSELNVLFRKSLKDHLNLNLNWSVILPEAVIKRWENCGPKGIAMVSDNTQVMVLKWCSVSTNGPKMCHEKIRHQPEPLIQSRMEQFFCALH